MADKSLVIAENPRCRVEVDIEAKHMIFRPVGQINEDLNFGKILQDINEVLSTNKPVSFDLGQVTKINSCGVREWLLFLERVQARVPVDFRMVSEIFIEQATVVPNLLGKSGTPVLAFEAPYYCGKCKSRLVKTLQTSSLSMAGQKDFVAPAQKCDKCGSPMEFDGLESEYFNFLTRGSK